MLDFDYIGVHPTGVVLVDQDRTGHKIHGVPVVSNLANVAEYVCREWFDEVLIVLPEDREIPQKVFDAFTEMGITIHVKIADVNEMQGKNQTVERMGNYTVITTCINMASAGQLILKRIMDICGGLVGCILTGIIFFVCRSCNLYQIAGADLLLTVPCWKERKKIQNLQIPQYVHGC